MNNRASNQQLIALGLLIFCAIAVFVGVFRLIRTPGDVKAIAPQERTSGTFLAGSGDRLAYITLDGMIMEDSSGTSPFTPESPAVRARKLLYFAAKDPSVKGVLLRLNSPGGTVGMSQELYNAVLAVKKNKPIVVSMGDLAASGAYYTAAAADRIVANPGTLTASIGVILQSVNLEGLLTDKLGVKAVTVKSGRFKDILSPYRPASPDELRLLQNIIDTSYRQFLKAVIDGRTGDITDPRLKAERIRAITAVADGRVVIGEQALQAGLVDAVGGLEDAKVLLQKMAAERFRIPDPERLNLQEYETPFDLWKFLGFSSSSQLGLHAAGWDENPRSLLPASLRYANQPLWLMESLN